MNHQLDEKIEVNPVIAVVNSMENLIELFKPLVKSFFNAK
jgi:hypothetical protein